MNKPTPTPLSPGPLDPRRTYGRDHLGNADVFLHAHVWPRYEWEPPDLVHRPVWLYPVERWRDEETALGPQHDALRASIAHHLNGR